MNEDLKKNIIKSAQKQMINLSESDLQISLSCFELYLKQFSTIEAFDLDDIEPMIFPYEFQSSLRKDIAINSLDKDTFLSMSINHDNDFVTIPKVIKK